MACPPAEKTSAVRFWQPATGRTADVFLVQAENIRSRIMPTYEIEQYELHVSKYRVQANSEGDAIAKLFAGEGEPVDQSLEFIEVANDYGLPADEFPELVQELAKLGVAGVGDVIPSIRSIDEV
jgi:hypothetical protein